jgi:hypothetical protein
MTPTPHGGPYTELTAAAAADLRRPIALEEVRFKIQSVTKDRMHGQAVAYIEARTVFARLNLLFPGHWQAGTTALPLDMRATSPGQHGRLTVRIEDEQVKADYTLFYRCRLTIAGAVFEDVGAGEDPKAAYSDALKRAAVRAGIGESLYAVDAQWLDVGPGDHQLRTHTGRPYLDPRTRAWLCRRYQAWLERVNAFGEPLAHAPAVPDAAGDPPDPDTATQAERRAEEALVAVALPDLPDTPTPGEDPTPESETQRLPAGGVSRRLQQVMDAATATGVRASTVNRLAVLLAGRAADTVLRLEALEDKVAAEVARRLLQAHEAGWDDATLADLVEKALRSHKYRTPAQRRKAFRELLDQRAAQATAGKHQHSGAQAA